MCGRTCLTLDPDGIVDACKYKSLKKRTSSSKQTPDHPDHPTKPNDSNVELVKPEWRSEFNCGRSYNPSYNIAPTDISPVLVAADYFDSATVSKSSSERVVVPMMWGMIPVWHKGDYRKHGLTTNNCRLEHLKQSKLYYGPFKRGQRCVILCEGFYEWQTTKPAKPSERAAHLLYMPQQEGIEIHDKSTWNSENIQLLKMAGLFDVWEDENGDKIYSYSVITFESSKIMSWLHHRMPAILETDDQVADWLNYKEVSAEKALTLLRPASDLKWHRVSNIVNNSRNKSEECNKPIPASTLANSATKQKGNGLMLKWLNSKKHSLNTDAENKNAEESTPKRFKTE